MHEEALFAASTYSDEQELIEFGKNYKASIIEGFAKGESQGSVPVILSLCIALIPIAPLSS